MRGGGVGVLVAGVCLWVAGCGGGQAATEATATRAAGEPGAPLDVGPGGEGPPLRPPPEGGRVGRLVRLAEADATRVRQVAHAPDGGLVTLSEESLARADVQSALYQELTLRGHDADGAVRWTVHLRPRGGNAGLFWLGLWTPQLLVEPSGDVLVALSARGGLELGGVHFLDCLVLARFTPTGALRWARALTPRNSGIFETVAGLVPAPGGGLYVAALVGPGLGAPATGSDGTSAVVLRLAADGSRRWMHPLTLAERSGPAGVLPQALAADAGGGVVVGGQYVGGRLREGGPLSREGAPFLLHLSAEGRPLRSVDFGAARGAVQALAPGRDGAVLAVGWFEGGLEEGGVRLEGVLGRPDAFLAASTAETGVQRLRQLCGVEVTGLASSPEGAWLAGRSMRGRVQLEEGVGWGGGEPAALVLALAPDTLQLRWARRLGAWPNVLTGLAPHPTRGLVVGGQLQTAADYEGSGLLQPQQPEGLLLWLSP